LKGPHIFFWTGPCWE